MIEIPVVGFTVTELAELRAQIPEVNFRPVTTFPDSFFPYLVHDRKAQAFYIQRSSQAFGILYVTQELSDIPGDAPFYASVQATHATEPLGSLLLCPYSLQMIMLALSTRVPVAEAQMWASLQEGRFDAEKLYNLPDPLKAHIAICSTCREEFQYFRRDDISQVQAFWELHCVSAEQIRNYHQAKGRDEWVKWHIRGCLACADAYEAVQREYAEFFIQEAQQLLGQEVFDTATKGTRILKGSYGSILITPVAGTPGSNTYTVTVKFDPELKCDLSGTASVNCTQGGNTTTLTVNERQTVVFKQLAAGSFTLSV